MLAAVEPTRLALLDLADAYDLPLMHRVYYLDMGTADVYGDTFESDVVEQLKRLTRCAAS